jgi:hypothetical protein
MASIANVTDNSSTLRVRRYRKRRRDGLRQLTVELPNVVIEEACVRGLLSVGAKNNPWSVVQSAYSSLLSDAALDWLIRNGVIAPEQRGDAVAILRGINNWLERAADLH